MAEDVPAAEAEPTEEEKQKQESEAKDEEKESKKPVRIPKEDPGDGLPKKPPQTIEFKWNKEMKDKKSCDTLHMLYLLQLALNLVRLRTIERNKYFKSIGRTDRYINQLDAPRIITNFLEWHNKNPEVNVFDGKTLDTKEKLFMINNMISDIGGVKKGPATKIYTKLKKDVVIETTTWLELPQPKLKLETWEWTKMYKNRKELYELSIDEIIKVLIYVNPDEKAWAPESTEEKEEKKNDDGGAGGGGDDEILRGVFQQVKWNNSFKTRVTKDGKKKNPKPSALEMSVMINGGNAIKKSDFNDFSKDTCTKEYIEAFEAKVKKTPARWEKLIVSFFRAQPRTYDQTGQYDNPDAGEFGSYNDETTFDPKTAKAPDQKLKVYDGPTFEPPPSQDGDEQKDNKDKKGGGVKIICQECMDYLIPPEIKNKKKKPLNTKLRGGVNQILRALKAAKVDAIIKAFDADNNQNMDAYK